MISVRQHAISLAAVFLALAVGLFIGSGFVGDRMNSLTGTSRDRIGALQDERDQLNDQLNSANSFDTAITGRVIGGTLRGQSVLVVTAPGAADADVAAVKDAIGGAGAKVSGQIGLTQQFVADQKSEQLSTIIDQTIPPGATLRAELVDSGGRAGDLLGALTLDRGGKGAASSDDRRTGLQALRDGGFIDYDGAGAAPADLAVVVTGGGYPEDSGAQGQLVARFAAALSGRGDGGALLGRTGSTSGGSPIAVVRADPGLSNAVSTVDNVDQQTGRITSILVLQEEKNGRSGAYGTGAGAKAITVGAKPADRPST